MKKFLLVAAVAAFTCAAYAQEVYPKVTKNWEVDMAQVTSADARQGVAIGDAMYVSTKAEMTVDGVTMPAGVYKVDKNGINTNPMPAGRNTGISKDQAGNLVVAYSQFPNTWSVEDPAFLVYAPAESVADDDITKLYINGDLAAMGRDDYLGLAEGDLKGDGKMWLVGATSTGIGIMNVMDGETSDDDSYVALCDGVNYGNVVCVYPVGNDELMYVNRSDGKVTFLEPDGDNYVIKETAALNGKGAANGAAYVVVNDTRYVITPSKQDGNNYPDGFCVYNIDDEADAHDPIYTEPYTKAQPNGVQANWIYAEPLGNNAIKMMQYIPGFKVMNWTIELAPATAVSDVNADKAVSSVKYYNVAGIESNEAFDGINVVVTSYVDGTTSARKVVK